LADPGAELRRPQVARIDEGRDVAQAGEQLALELDRFDERAAVGKRMGAPGFRKTANERAYRRVEKDGLDSDAFAAKLREQRQEMRQRAGAAHVNGDGDAPVAPLLLEAQEVAQRRRGLAVRFGCCGVGGHEGLRARTVSRSDDPDDSISCACARLVDESFSPPSMRAISATRDSPATASAALRVLPPSVCLETTK